MPRTARLKSQEAAYYHLYNRVAGPADYYPFQRHPAAARRFLALLEFYLRLYFCRLGAFQLLGNHYHAVVHFPAYRPLSSAELQKRARLRFGRLWRLRTAHWGSQRWNQFNRNLFDLSCFMQHVNGEFSKWFNRRYHRRGPLWADRFRNPQLLDSEAVQKTILYCELNALRAHLVARPEDSRYGSAYWRWAQKKSDLLIPLEELFPPTGQQSSYQIYRSLLYHCGQVAPREGQGVISEKILREEEKRDFAPRGLFLRRFPCFTEGVALGSHQQVLALLEQYRRRGLYRRRRNPIPQLDGLLFSLREQRSHAFAPG